MSVSQTSNQSLLLAAGSSGTKAGSISGAFVDLNAKQVSVEGPAEDSLQTNDTGEKDENFNQIFNDTNSKEITKITLPNEINENIIKVDENQSQRKDYDLELNELSAVVDHEDSRLEQIKDIKNSGFLSKEIIDGVFDDKEFLLKREGLVEHEIVNENKGMAIINEETESAGVSFKGGLSTRIKNLNAVLLDTAKDFFDENKFPPANEIKINPDSVGALENTSLFFKLDRQGDVPLAFNINNVTLSSIDGLANENATLGYPNVGTIRGKELPLSEPRIAGSKPESLFSSNISELSDNTLSDRAEKLVTNVQTNSDGGENLFSQKSDHSPQQFFMRNTSTPVSDLQGEQGERELVELVESGHEQKGQRQNNVLVNQNSQQKPDTNVDGSLQLLAKGLSSDTADRKSITPSNQIKTINNSLEAEGESLLTSNSSSVSNSKLSGISETFKSGESISENKIPLNTTLKSSLEAEANDSVDELSPLKSQRSGLDSKMSTSALENKALDARGFDLKSGDLRSLDARGIAPKGLEHANAVQATSEQLLEKSSDEKIDNQTKIQQSFIAQQEIIQRGIASKSILSTQLSNMLANPQWSHSVGDKVLRLAAQNIQSAEIQLDPPELGQLQIKINLTLNQEVASVNFVSAHPSVREALDASSARLREMFQQEGMDLVNVGVSDQSKQQNSFGDNDDGQSTSQENGGQSFNASNTQPPESDVVLASAIELKNWVDFYA
ncbi:MAG: flagellar hook-length control protein FliK [Cellvibrionaceae bacterium]